MHGIGIFFFTIRNTETKSVFFPFLPYVKFVVANFFLLDAFSLPNPLYQ